MFQGEGHKLERVKPAYKMAKRMSRPTDREKPIKETQENEE